jgi:hypothetical protein
LFVPGFSDRPKKWVTPHLRLHINKLYVGTSMRISDCKTEDIREVVQEKYGSGSSERIAD